MSRIDEAFKRASQGSLAGRNAGRSADTPLRLADELNEYPLEQRPLEQRSSHVHPERSHESSDHASQPLRRADVSRPSGTVSLEQNEKLVVGRASGPTSLEQNEKLVVGRDCNPVSLEQYRRLAATLHDAQLQNGLRTVMVTSAVPKEGKTLTAVNLALTLSESYRRRVILIDADLRRPSVHQVLRMRNERGLTDVLRAEKVELPIVQVSSNLSVLVCGRPDRNPLAGLSSERMRTVLEDFATRFDWVLLDTPPVGLLSDAQVLSRLAQAAVFVIRAGWTPFNVVERSLNELGRDRIIGTVLNGVEQQSIPATSYYGSYYAHE